MRSTDVPVAFSAIRRIASLCVLAALLVGCRTTSQWSVSVPRIAEDRVSGMVITPDGCHMVVVGGRWHAMLQEPLPGYAVVVDIKRRAVVRELPQQGDGVSAVGLLDAGKSVVAASYDGTLLFWSFATPAVSRRVDLRASEGTGVNLAMVVAPDEKQIAVAGYRGNTRLDASSVLVCDAGGRVLRRFEVGSSPIRSMAFAPDNRMVAMCDIDEGAVRLLDTVTGELRIIRPGDPTFRDSPITLGFTKAGKLLIGGKTAGLRSGMGWVELWNVNPSHMEVRGNSGGVVNSICTDGQRVLVVQSGANALQLWSMDTLKPMAVTLNGVANPSRAVLAQDGRAVFYVTADGIVGAQEVKQASNESK